MIPEAMDDVIVSNLGSAHKAWWRPLVVRVQTAKEPRNQVPRKIWKSKGGFGLIGVLKPHFQFYLLRKFLNIK
jgi:hypothetical protein